MCVYIGELYDCCVCIGGRDVVVVGGHFCRLPPKFGFMVIELICAPSIADFSEKSSELILLAVPDRTMYLGSSPF